MHTEFLSLLACPSCGGPLRAEAAVGGGGRRDEGSREGGRREDTGWREDTGALNGEIVEGALRCEGCETTLPIRAGVPRQALDDSSIRAPVADAFSAQWDAYDRGAFERDTVYGRDESNLWRFFLDATGVGETAIERLTVLDAGCGPASISRQVAQRGARAVVALDISDAVDAVYAQTHMRLRNLHPLQADLFAAPLGAAFDLVWSAGVIHHTDDAAAAFHALTRYVRPGGTLFVYVYPSTLKPFHWANVVLWCQALLKRLGLRRLPRSLITPLANLLSYPTVVLHRGYRASRRLPGLRPRTANARDGVMPITRRAFAMIWNDALVPPRTSLHSAREVVGWFRAAGFTDVEVTPVRPVGVRGRAPLRG